MRHKAILCVFLAVVISSNAIAQTEEILGSWTSFAIDNGEFYLNIETDSVALYQEFDHIKNDSIKIIELKQYASEIYFPQTHVFNENGKYSWAVQMFNFESDYRLDESRKIILISENAFEDEKRTQEIPYRLENGILYLEIPETEPAVKLWLRK